MATLTVVIITRNEEKRIKNCLESIKDLADEIIVIDDFSTDKTVEIAKNYGAKVFIRAMNKDFSSQRNFGIEKASGEWVFFLDADEIVTSFLKEEIKKRLEREKFVAYQIGIQNCFYGHFLSYVSAKEYKIRLIRKGFAYYEGKVHEKLIINGPIGKMKNYFIHQISDSIDKLILKTLEYTDLEAGQYLEGKKEISFKEIRYRLTWKALKLFWKLYVKKKGYKDGMYGLVWCILNVIGPEIRWLKIWEKALKEGKLREE